MNTIGRNDRCLCGSGKKFKKCCLLSKSNDGVSRMASLEMIKQRVQKRDVFEGSKDSIFVHEPSGFEKMSKIILDFAHPLLNGARSFDDYHKVILTAILAWNLGLSDKSDTKLEKLCNDLSHTMDDSQMVEFQQRLAMMIQRKREHFSEINRMVMDWDLVPMRNSFHLNVVSTLIGDDKDFLKCKPELKKFIDSLQSV